MWLHSLGPVLLQHLPVHESLPELTTSNQNSFLVLNFILSKAESVKSTSNVMRQTYSRRFLLRTGLSDLILFKGVRYNRACIKVVVPELIRTGSLVFINFVKFWSGILGLSKGEALL